MIKDDQIYQVNFHDSTHTDANPYHLWVETIFFDERFATYLQDICFSKRIVIYQTQDPLLSKLKFFGINDVQFHIDRIENILSVFKDRYITENDVLDVDLTADIEFKFPTKKERLGFHKQYENSLRRIILFEHKKYTKLLKELNLSPSLNTPKLINGEVVEMVDAEYLGNEQATRGYVVDVEPEQPLQLEAPPKKYKGCK